MWQKASEGCGWRKDLLACVLFRLIVIDDNVSATAFLLQRELASDLLTSILFV